MKNKWLLSLILLMIILAGCSNTADSDSDIPEQTFTIEELSTFTGKDGSPAYIAIDGVVYDVTRESQWRGGIHNGFEAGKDLTDEIKNMSPHGVSKLRGVPIVGKLVE